jgi:hypothetical protein
VRGSLGEEGHIGPRGTILVAALAHTIPFWWSLFGSLGDATTAEPGGTASALEV